MKIQPHQVQLVREAVAAKCRYWDALRALEVSVVGPDKTWSSVTDDQVEDAMSNMAAGMGEAVLDSSMVPDDDIIKQMAEVFP